MELAKKVLEYRAEHKLTQPEFAKLCDTSASTIWRLENGKPILQITEAKIRMKVEGREV